MKHIIPIGIAALIAAYPVAASAHQHAVYEIGGERYEIVIGSLHEPIAVDDKTGVDLRVSMPDHTGMPATGHHAAGGAVAGLENTLKVELIAGDKRKTLDLAPVYNTPGSYAAAFYPTVATTLQYRVFGTINEIPVDLTFTCRAEGAAAADEGEMDISDGVKQISKGGGFGCPADKEVLGFPEASAANAEVASTARSANVKSMGGIALGGLALVLSVMAYRRR